MAFHTNIKKRKYKVVALPAAHNTLGVDDSHALLHTGFHLCLLIDRKNNLKWSRCYFSLERLIQ
jgi:hypothetical protein